MESICPFAEYKPLPESKTQPGIKPVSVILHSDASNWTQSLFNFFRNSSNLESHFHIDKHGQIEQYLPITIRADANYRANRFWKDGQYQGAVSIETASSVTATGPWTPAQYDAIVRLVRWICDTAGIPAVKCPTWDGKGIGYHIQFGSPGAWTPVAKSCPGPARIAQVPSIIADVANHEEDDMFTEDDRKKIDYIYKQFAESVPSELDKHGKETKAGTLRWRITNLMNRTSDLVTGRRPQ